MTYHVEKSPERQAWEAANPGYENRSNAEWERFRQTGSWVEWRQLTYADLSALTPHFVDGFFEVPYMKEAAG